MTRRVATSDVRLPAGPSSTASQFHEGDDVEVVFIHCQHTLNWTELHFSLVFGTMTSLHSFQICPPVCLVEQLLVISNSKKGSSYSIAKRRVPELIPVLGSCLQVTWVINPAVGCHYFPSGPQGCYHFRCLVNRGTMGVNSSLKTVTGQRRDCDLNPGPFAPESASR